VNIQAARISFRTGSAILALILTPFLANADGGLVRTKQAQGPFIITLFTPADVSRGFPTDVTVLVQSRDTGEAVLDAEVALEFVDAAGAGFPAADPVCGLSQNATLLGPVDATGRPRSFPATHAEAANKLLYGTFVVFPAAGDWQLRATVRQGGQATTVMCILPVALGPPRLAGLWPCLVLPLLAIALFSTNQWLRRRPLEGVSVPTRLRSPAGQQPEMI